MSTQPLKVGCLGAGYFSQFHYDAWKRNPRTQLLASADHSVDKAQGTGALHAYANLQDLLQNQAVDIVDIITPPPTHLNAIKEALKFPIKAIICQKPFCESIEQAEKAIALAADAGVPLIVHENFRFQPWFRCIKQALEQRRIGTVLQFTFRLRTGDGQGPDAYLARQPYFRDMPRFLIHETGVHYLDTIRYLLGDATSVYADLRTLNPAIKGEDAGYVVLSYNDGTRAVIDGNRLLDHSSNNTRLTFGEALIEGTDGDITLQGNGCVSIRKFGETQRSELLAAQSWPGFAGDCVYALQEHVVSALLNGTAVENTAADYLAVMRAVEAVYQSANSGMKQPL